MKRKFLERDKNKITKLSFECFYIERCIKIKTILKEKTNRFHGPEKLLV